MVKYFWMFILVALLLSSFMLILSALFKASPVNLNVTKAQPKIEFIDIKNLDLHSECREIGKKISHVLNNGRACQTNEDCVIGRHLCPISINKSSYLQLKLLRKQKKAIGNCGNVVASCARGPSNPQPVCIENLCKLIYPDDLKKQLLTKARKNKA